MDNKLMKDIEYRACKEMEELHKKKDLSPADWDMLSKMASTVKNLKKIEEHETGYAMTGMGGYAQAGRWVANGSMEGEYGHAGRHRNSMGQYTNDGGYSQHGDTLSAMKELRRNAKGREREAIDRCIREIDNGL